MPTPKSRLTTAQMNTLNASTLGSLKPYQVEQAIEFINRLKWDRGSNSDLSVQPTFTAIVTAIGSNNP